MAKTLHRLDLSQPGTFTDARIVCLATEERACRQWCAETDPVCEEGCTGTPVLWPATVELVAQAPTGEHQWKPVGGCREADWINAVGVEDSHDSVCEEERFPFDDEGAQQLGVRAGYVQIEWTGDDYMWTYAADGDPVDQPVAVHPDQLTVPGVPS